MTNIISSAPSLPKETDREKLFQEYNRLSSFYLIEKDGMEIQLADEKTKNVSSKKLKLPVGTLMGYINYYSMFAGKSKKEERDFGFFVTPDEKQYYGKILNKNINPDDPNESAIDTSYLKDCRFAKSKREEYLCAEIRLMNKSDILKVYNNNFYPLNENWTEDQLRETKLKQMGYWDGKFSTLSFEDEKRLVEDTMIEYIKSDKGVIYNDLRCVCIGKNETCGKPFWTMETVKFFKDHGHPSINTINDLMNLTKFNGYSKDRKMYTRLKFGQVDVCIKPEKVSKRKTTKI